MASNCVLCKTKFQTIYLDKSKRNILEQWPYGISGRKARMVGQRKMKRKAPLKICCQLFKSCSQSFCCITLLTSCKWKHIMHADWLQQQQIATQRWCKWTFLKTSLVFIRMKFPVPIGKQTVSHCTLSQSGSGTKVYQWAFCQITTIMTRQWWYLTLRMFSTTSKNTLETMFMIMRSGLMDHPVSLRINTSLGLLASPYLSW